MTMETLYSLLIDAWLKKIITQNFLSDNNMRIEALNINDPFVN